MSGTILAVNRNLNVLVVETQNHLYLVLEVLKWLECDLGDELEADWTAPGVIAVHNTTHNCDIQARVQRTETSRNEAICCAAVI